MHIHSYWHCLKVLIEFSKNQTERSRKGGRQESGKTGGGKEEGERDGNAEKGRDIQSTDKARGCKEEKDGNERQRGASKVTKGVGGGRRGEDTELLHALLYSPQPRHVFLCHCRWHANTLSPSETVCDCVHVHNCSVFCMFVCLPWVSVFNMQPDGLIALLLPREPLSSTLLLYFSVLLSPPWLSSAPLPFANQSIHNSLIAALVSVCTDDSSPVSEAKYQTAIAATCLWGIYVWIWGEAFHWCRAECLKYTCMNEWMHICLYRWKLLIIWLSQGCWKHKHTQERAHMHTPFVQ